MFQPTLAPAPAAVSETKYSDMKKGAVGALTRVTVDSAAEYRASGSAEDFTLK